MKKLPYLLALLFLYNCQKKDSDAPISQITIEVQKKIGQFNDSTFVDQTLDIHYHSGSLFLTEIKNARILQVDEEYNLKTIFGGKGDGPAELSYPEAAQVYNNQLLILDNGHQKIKAFNLDGSISHQFGRDIPDNSGFFIQNDQLFGSRYTKPELPIFAYNLTNNDSTQYFGSQNRKLTVINYDRPRVFHLFPFKNNIVAVSKNEPVIERFDLEGNKTEELYYPEYFEAYILNAKEREKTLANMRPTFSFVSDATLLGNELYILTVGFDESKAVTTSNHIFNFSIEDSKITLSRIIELQNGGEDIWYLSFEVFEHKIVAFESRSYELHEFNLPKVK